MSSPRNGVAKYIMSNIVITAAARKARLQHCTGRSEIIKYQDNVDINKIKIMDYTYYSLKGVISFPAKFKMLSP